MTVTWPRAVRGNWCSPAFVLDGAVILYGLEAARHTARPQTPLILDWPLRCSSGSGRVVPLAGLAARVVMAGSASHGVHRTAGESLRVPGRVRPDLRPPSSACSSRSCPFLVWYGTYSVHIWAGRVCRTLADMYSDQLAARRRGGTYLLRSCVDAGILLSSASTVRWGGVVMAAAVDPPHCEFCVDPRPSLSRLHRCATAADA